MLSISIEIPAWGDGVAGEDTPWSSLSHTGTPVSRALIMDGVWVAGMDVSVGSTRVSVGSRGG